MSSKREDFIYNVLSVVSIILGVILFVGLIWGGFALGAKYSVWSQAQAGKAELSRADWNRQITIKEAEAKRQAAISLAAAEVERAKGVAAANKIIGDSLQNNEEYLRYLWIDNIKEAQGKGQIIYVPTEANLPILEASRLNK